MLDERGRRRFAGAEVLTAGRGSVGLRQLNYSLQANRKTREGSHLTGILQGPGIVPRLC